MRCVRILLAGIAAALLGVPLRAAEPLLVYCALRTPSAPRLDGRVDDGCWKEDTLS